MIELYGNKIWNSNTPNKYKKVIIANEDSFDNICQELENSGLNYCAYIFNGEAHIAIGRATATNIDKLDIDYQTVIECNLKVYKTNNIIGTTTYDSIEDKLYRKYNTDFAYKIGQRLTEQGILFSGRIYGKTTTITVDKHIKRYLLYLIVLREHCSKVKACHCRSSVNYTPILFVSSSAQAMYSSPSLLPLIKHNALCCLVLSTACVARCI